MSEDEIKYYKVNKLFISSALTLCISALDETAKAYIDVENLKTKIKYSKLAQKNIKQDIREIKNDIKTILQRLPKE